MVNYRMVLMIMGFYGNRGESPHEQTLARALFWLFFCFMTRRHVLMLFLHDDVRSAKAVLFVLMTPLLLFLHILFF